MKNTKIICTIGPASQKPEIIKEMILAGMNVARMNFSHGSYEEQEMKLRMVREVSQELGMPIALLQDTKGPEIRLRDFKNGKEELKEGQTFVLTTEEIEGTNERVSISYKNLPNDVEKGMPILIDDGLIEMSIQKITDTEITCKVINGGFVSNKKGVNVPGAKLSMPFISDVDRADIEFGIKMGFDFIAASFVRCKEDILEVRKILDEHGAKTKIIAKIENMQGIDNLDEIIDNKEEYDFEVFATNDERLKIVLDYVFNDFDKNKELIEKYEVKGYPTIIILKDGVEMKRLTGLQQKPALIKAIEEQL